MTRSGKPETVLSLMIMVVVLLMVIYSLGIVAERTYAIQCGDWWVDFWACYLPNQKTEWGQTWTLAGFYDVWIDGSIITFEYLNHGWVEGEHPANPGGCPASCW